jgi:Carbamoyltransferase C-terminus/Saxitoxin biosynthesis operon protein SxtJ
VVGWFQGRMEFGPRALGNRSILGDPRRSDMQEKLNLKIKFRESFRPFAPAVMEERSNDCFDLTVASPYMLLVAPIQEALRTKNCSRRPVGDARTDLLGMLKQRRSTLPAITHVDYSARVQTVSNRTNPRFYNLLSAFERRTGCPVLVNTSFNVRGEPPVCTPQDAFRCFMKTDMDYLVLGNFLVAKAAVGAHVLPPTSAVVPAPGVTRSTLRRFGLTIGFASLLLGMLLQFRHRSAGLPLTSLAVLLLLVSAIAPGLLRFIYRPWMRVAQFLGAISSRILLTILFFLALTPIGLLQRLFGKRPIDLRFRTNDTINWQQRTTGGTPADYEKQF